MLIVDYYILLILRFGFITRKIDFSVVLMDLALAILIGFRIDSNKNQETDIGKEGRNQ